MNDNVAKLIEALRSGRYVQTTGQLRKDNSFCWAGVACNIFDPQLEISWVTLTLSNLSLK
jgi:hypothetical protein